MADYVESMAYRGDKPWHGIGFPIHTAVTPAEMLRLANLDWSVSKRPLYTPVSKDLKTGGQSSEVMALNDLSALVRDSDNKIFGVCGPKYTPFQNSETFEFFNKFTEAGHMKMEVAGSLKGGTWIWALARLEGEAFQLMESDPNYSYLLLVSPHVWGEAMTVMFTSVRVVCWNTLTQALNKKLSDKFRFIHNRSFVDVKSLAELSVEQAMIHKMVYEQKAKLLSESKIVDMTKLYNYIAQVVQPGLLESGDAKPTEFGKQATQILTNIHTAPGAKLPSAHMTWWGAFNAVTYYFDHQAGRVGPDKRLYDAWVSHYAAVIKRKAFDTAVNYAQAA